MAWSRGPKNDRNHEEVRDAHTIWSVNFRVGYRRSRDFGHTCNTTGPITQTTGSDLKLNPQTTGKRVEVGQGVSG